MLSFVPLRCLAVVGLWAGWVLLLSGQVVAHAPEGLRENPNRKQALVGGRIVVRPGEVIPVGTVVMDQGMIVSVTSGRKAPADARVWDVTGRTIYAGLIDPWTQVRLPAAWKAVPPRASDDEDSDEPAPKTENEARRGPQSWNPRLLAERRAAEVLVDDTKGVEALRELGFSAVATVPGRGIWRGQSAVVDLSDRPANLALIQADAAQQVAFELAGFSEDVYPNSLMGAVAMVRQTVLEARWYAQCRAISAKSGGKGETPETNPSLAALKSAVEGKSPVVFQAEDELDVLRIARLAEELRLQAAVLGTGYEYRILRALKKTPMPLVLPVNFPSVPEIETPEKALDVRLDQLQHWELAATNPARVQRAGLTFALTTHGLENAKKDFWPNVRKAVAQGLTKEAALAALTTRPAQMLGVADRLGTVEPGKRAHLVVATGDLFEAGTEITQVWTGGDVFEMKPAQTVDFRGTWKLTGVEAAKSKDWVIEGDVTKLKAKLGEEPVRITAKGKTLFWALEQKSKDQTETPVWMSGEWVGTRLEGTGQTKEGAFFRWTAERVKPFVAEAGKDGAKKPDVSLAETALAYPAGSYGLKDAPVQPAWILIRGGTVWTSGPQGIVENADVLVHAGKIYDVGRNLTVPNGAVVIDAKGCHVTPGIIDCHSHTSISRGVNEGTNAVTMEVRIGDVVDATDVALYRELAGGVTTANLLHGSANPMGGQNQVIKLRWGQYPEGLKFEGAMPGVKFALGENVKQANWGERYTKRYPQTRMGVEQIMRDTFLAAQDYEQALLDFKQGRRAYPPSPDLRLQAALEILHHQRLVHIHSYRQDEILMFARLSQDLAFTIGTFQHVLEGYKVADTLAKIKAGASTFSDWFNFKYEVIDAIPYNASLLNAAGVVTSMNSDSNEMARHLNTEAAKAVKYGGMAPAEALKLVTLNPARQLRIDQRTGSLEKGKDADVVIWSDSPLSSYARVEQTWIDGRNYFDQKKDRLMREAAEQERTRLIAKALPDRLDDIGLGALPEEGEKKPEKDKKPKALDGMRLIDALHYADERRGLYDNGRDKHNCVTTHGRGY